MKKRIVALAMAGLMVLSAVGCGPSVSGGGSEGKEQETTSEKKEESKGDGEVVLQVVDMSDSTKARREEYNKKFEEENNCKVEYTVLAGDQYQTTINSSIKANTAPDLFALPSGVKLSTAVEEGWYMPMNDYVEDGFFDTFAEGALNEGITTMDGQVYVLPESANIVNTLVFYNKNVLEDAGVDTENLPKTWSEFREVCKQVTEAGKGKYYGMIEGGKQVNRLEIAIRALSCLAGSKSNDIGVISMVDGKNVLNSDAMIQAFDFYSGLVQDGSFHPDSVNLAAPEARALFAQNQAAFLIQGSWCISTWEKENPELEFGVMEMPVPDDGAKGGLPYIGAQPWMGISKTSDNPELAAKYLQGLYSEEYQSGVVEDGGFVSAIKGVNEKYMKDGVMKDYYTLALEQGKLCPDPIVGNADASAVYANITEISPNLGQIVQGTLTGKTDYKDTLNTLAENTQKEWENGIKKAQEAGAEVSAEDFEFKNWNPLEDYTAEDYQNK